MSEAWKAVPCDPDHNDIRAVANAVLIQPNLDQAVKAVVAAAREFKRNYAGDDGAPYSRERLFENCEALDSILKKMEKP